MAVVSYHTIMLSRGKHDFPEDGACVMELASMLAGEPFSDPPRSVCPVIGPLLGAYNDRIDDARRQEMYASAAKVIDSRASQDVQQARRAPERAGARAASAAATGRAASERIRAVMSALSRARGVADEMHATTNAGLRQPSRPGGVWLLTPEAEARLAGARRARGWFVVIAVTSTPADPSPLSCYPTARRAVRPSRGC